MLKKYHTFQNYLHCLQTTHDYIIARYRMVGSHTQQREIHTDYIIKQTLSPLDSKRFMVGAEETLPYGHYGIRLVLEESGEVNHVCERCEEAADLDTIISGVCDNPNLCRPTTNANKRHANTAASAATVKTVSSSR